MLIDLTEDREQVDVGNLGVNSRDGELHMKKNVFLFGVLQKVTNEEERVDPGGLRFSLSKK